MGKKKLHLPASSFGAKWCGCQAPCLRKCQKTSEGPVPFRALLAQGALRVMIKRSVCDSRYVQMPLRGGSQGCSVTNCTSPSEETDTSSKAQQQTQLCLSRLGLYAAREPAEGWRHESRVGAAPAQDTGALRPSPAKPACVLGQAATLSGPLAELL